MTVDKMLSGNSIRLQTCSIAEGGTPVEDWTSWDHEFASLNIADCPGLVIVSPHPDDETLGLGATAAMLSEARVDVHLVSVSDGGAAYPGLAAERRTQLEMLRTAEIRCAAKVLGAGEPIRLEMPDGELHQCEQQISDAIAAILARFPPGTWCAATWRGDGHPDHEATGRAAAAAAAQSGAVFVEYPVWMWHWAQPGDPAVPWHRVRRVALSDRALRLKRLATHCFASQVEPTRDGSAVLSPIVVERLLAVGEVVFV